VRLVPRPLALGDGKLSLDHLIPRLKGGLGLD
jgi:hypothetical protein